MDKILLLNLDLLKLGVNFENMDFDYLLKILNAKTEKEKKENNTNSNLSQQVLYDANGNEFRLGGMVETLSKLL